MTVVYERITPHRILDATFPLTHPELARLDPDQPLLDNVAKVAVVAHDDVRRGSRRLAPLPVAASAAGSDELLRPRLLPHAAASDDDGGLFRVPRAVEVRGTLGARQLGPLEYGGVGPGELGSELRTSVRVGGVGLRDGRLLACGYERWIT